MERFSEVRQATLTKASMLAAAGSLAAGALTNEIESASALPIDPGGRLAHLEPPGANELPAVHKNKHRHKPAKVPRILKIIGGCESVGNPNGPINYRAQNPTSSASGGYQITDGTWAKFHGYVHAKLAPKKTQDRKAVQLYHQRGTQPWISSKPCWGRFEG
jgi:hypothetical protein